MLDRKIEPRVEETDFGSEILTGKLEVLVRRGRPAIGVAFKLTLTNHDRNHTRHVREVRLQVRRRRSLFPSRVLGEGPVYDAVTNRLIAPIDVPANGDSTPILCYAIVNITASILYDIIAPIKLPMTLKLFNIGTLVPVQYYPVDYLTFSQLAMPGPADGLDGGSS